MSSCDGSQLVAQAPPPAGPHSGPLEGRFIRLVVMQPYFLPCLGCFDLLNMTDEWNSLDQIKHYLDIWRPRALQAVAGGGVAV
jgi:hypothetical protein